jgi:hypothetical protein
MIGFKRHLVRFVPTHTQSGNNPCPRGSRVRIPVAAAHQHGRNWDWPIEEAIKRSGVRMVVVGDVPSPWGEAAKGILHIKGIEWVAVRLTYDSEP